MRRMGQRRRKRLLRKGLFAILPVILLLGLLELFAVSQAPEEGFAPGGALGWTVQADLQDFWVRQPPPREDFFVSTNEDGLRSSYDRSKTEGTKRLIKTLFRFRLIRNES